MHLIKNYLFVQQTTQTPIQALRLNLNLFFSLRSKMKEPVIDKSLKRMYQSLPAPINLPTHRQHLEFGVFSPQHIKSLSVLELHERNLYDLSANKRSPQAFGVLDKRLVPLALINSSLSI